MQQYAYFDYISGMQFLIPCDFSFFPYHCLWKIKLMIFWNVKKAKCWEKDVYYCVLLRIAGPDAIIPWRC